MKHLFLIALSFVLLNLVTNAKAEEKLSGSSMKLEGTCSGTLVDGSPVSFSYYSNFDGVSDSSRSAVTFSEGIEGLYTGSRSFQGGRDVYKVSQHQLSFADSTGNTFGKLTYPNQDGNSETVEVQCDIRDYHYDEVY